MEKVDGVFHLASGGDVPIGRFPLRRLRLRGEDKRKNQSLEQWKKERLRIPHDAERKTGAEACRDQKKDKRLSSNSRL
eukprot:scaffold3410_cov141-Cylindrotheca_fusiformis.AAC.10